MAKQSLKTIICYDQGEVRWRFTLNKRKLLVGSCEHADILIDDPHVSHYHAMIVLEDDGVSVIDLKSDNGLWLNGQRVNQAMIGDGDRLRFGPVEFLMDELVNETGRIENVDQEVIRLAEEDIGSLLPELTPKEGLVIIDDEYCDITFDEVTNYTVNLKEILSQTIDAKSFIDPTEMLEDEEDIVVPNDDRSLEVMVLSNGVILGTEYLPLTQKNYFLAGVSSKNSVLFPILEKEQKIPFAKNLGTSIEYLEIPEFEKVESNDGVSWSFRTLQVSVREIDTPPHLKTAPLWGRDKAFWKESSKIFGAMMGMMLLLLLVDTSVKPPEEKQIAIIYRKAVKSQDVSQTKTAENPNKVDKDEGVKQKEYEKKEVKTAKAAANPQQQQVPAAAPQPAAASAQPKVAEKPKMKAYEFKMNSAMSSFMNSKTPSVDTKSASRSLASTSNVNAANVNSKNALKAQAAGAVGTIGESMNGAFNQDSGAKGLAAKGGMDTTYSAPKTVIMGSMDPELLRKILAEYLPQFRHCYQQELQRQEDVEGVLDMNFRIDGAGKVSKINIKAKDSRFSGGGVDCMASVLRLIDFPKPKGGGVVDVRQPLNFFSEKAKI